MRKGEKGKVASILKATAEKEVQAQLDDEEMKEVNDVAVELPFIAYSLHFLDCATSNLAHYPSEITDEEWAGLGELHSMLAKRVEDLHERLDGLRRNKCARRVAG